MILPWSEVNPQEARLSGEGWHLVWFHVGLDASQPVARDGWG